MDFSDLLADATPITNFTVLIGSVLYILRYYISKRYHKDVDNNLELIDSILDMGIDKATQTESKVRILGHKIKFLLQKFGWIKKDPINTIPVAPSINDSHSIPFDFVQFQQRIESMIDAKMNEMTALVNVKMDAMTEIVDNHIINSGALMSGIQLEYNHLVDKVQKAVPNLDYNNGDGEVELEKERNEVVAVVSADFIIHEEAGPTIEQNRDETRKDISEAAGVLDSGIHPVINEEEDPNELTEYEKELLAEDD